MKSPSPFRSYLVLGLLAFATPVAWCADEAIPGEEAKPDLKDRPKLSSIDRLGEASRLEVHGGASFTIGGASGGGSFREYAGWASFYDPVSRIAVGVSYANFSSNGLVPCLPDLGLYDDYNYGLGYSSLNVDSRQRLSALSDYDYGTRMAAFPGKVRGQTTDVAVRLPLTKSGSSAITIEASNTRLTSRR